MPSRPARNKRRSNKKWSPVLSSEYVSGDVNASSSGFKVVDLCANSINAQTAPTATVIKCGNFKIVADINTNAAFNSTGRMYVMYLPQNYTADANLPIHHPEWILCWRGFEPGQTGVQSFSMQSKLKRNLNSGDKCVLLVTYTNLSSSAAHLSIACTFSYVCCAN